MSVKTVTIATCDSCGKKEELMFNDESLWTSQLNEIGWAVVNENMDTDHCKECVSIRLQETTNE